MRVDIESILEAKEILNIVNRLNLPDIVFYENDKIVNIDIKKIDDFVFTGLNNTDFILSGFYKDD